MTLSDIESLSDMDLDEVSFVDRGSNPGAKLVFFKREEKQPSHSGITISTGVLNNRSVIFNYSFKEDIWDKDRCEAWLKKRGIDRSEITHDRDNKRFNAYAVRKGVTQVRSFSLGKEIEKALDAGVSWENIQSSIRTAVYQRFGDDVYCRDIWSDQLVVEKDYGEQFFRIPFSLSISNSGVEVLFGPPVRVKLMYVDAEVDEELQKEHNQKLEDLKKELSKIRSKMVELLKD